MADQKLIDKYLKEFYEVQRLKVPIELNSYLHRMIDEALHIHGVNILICEKCNKNEQYVEENPLCLTCLLEIYDKQNNS
jgi:hypothetical protein